jgi:hypothetical protein
VNIYRLITEHTIEENILKKSNQKKHMNDVVIGDGQFNTQFFDKLDPRELLGLEPKEGKEAGAEETATYMPPAGQNMAKILSSFEDEEDRDATSLTLTETATQFQEITESEDQAALRNSTETKAAKKPRSALEASLTSVQRWSFHYAEVRITPFSPFSPIFSCSPFLLSSCSVSSSLIIPAPILALF